MTVRGKSDGSEGGVVLVIGSSGLIAVKTVLVGVALRRLEEELDGEEREKIVEQLRRELGRS